MLNPQGAALDPLPHGFTFFTFCLYQDDSPVYPRSLRVPELQAPASPASWARHPTCIHASHDQSWTPAPATSTPVHSPLEQRTSHSNGCSGQNPCRGPRLPSLSHTPIQSIRLPPPPPPSPLSNYNLSLTSSLHVLACLAGPGHHHP